MTLVSSTEAGVVFLYAFGLFDHCGPFYPDFLSIEVETGKMYDMCEKRLVIAENTQYKLI